MFIARFCRIARIALALCSGALVSAVLILVFAVLASPDSLSYVGTSQIAAYSAVAFAFTLPIALIVGSLSYQLLQYIPFGLGIVMWCCNGILAGALVCAVNGSFEFIALYAFIGLVAAAVSYVLLPSRSTNRINRGDGSRPGRYAEKIE